MSQKTFSASLDQLHEMLSFIEQYVKKYTNIDHQIHEIILSSEEVLVNIIRYAYSPEHLKNIDIGCEFNPREERVLITFRDEGKAFNPLTDSSKRLKTDPKNDVGGQGILMLKKLMDSVDYQRVGNCNVLCITKKVIL
jgi:serine/threonine-protein kinase RsbW